MANKGVDEGACACACACAGAPSVVNPFLLQMPSSWRVTTRRGTCARNQLHSANWLLLSPTPWRPCQLLASHAAATSLCTSCAATRSSHPCPSQNGTLSGDSSYQRTLFGVHYQMSRLESVCVALSQEHHSLQQLKDSTRASIAATEADIHALQGQLRSARKKRSSAEIYDGACAAASRFGCAADSLQQA